MDNRITFATAFVIACVAEYFSILGLTTIYPAAFYSIIIMGISLAAGKIVSTNWLFRNWKTAPPVIKYYLTTAVVILMLLTSMGTFGYLSKAHSDQGLVYGDLTAQLKVHDDKIKYAQEKIDNNRKALKQLDEAVDQIMVRSSDEKGADKAVALRRSQQKERSRFISEIQAEQTNIEQINEVRAPLAERFRKAESEVGPVSYIAQILYGSSDAEILEKSIRFVTILIVSVFDPLAVALLIASYVVPTTNQQLPKKKKTTKIELDSNSILKL